MTLLGAIRNYLDGSSDAAAVAFRSALGTGKVAVDRPGDSVAMPYCVLVDLGATPVVVNTTHTQRVDSHAVQFSVFGGLNNDVDGVLDQLDDIFAGPERVTLTITNRTHLTTSFTRRMNLEDPRQDVLHGLIEFAFLTDRG